MLNSALPVTTSLLSGGEKKDNQIRLGDGEEFTGVILQGDQVETQYGPAYKFTFEIKGKEMVLFTTNEYLAGKLNETTKGDTVTVQRTGLKRETRWHVEVIDRVAGE